MDSLTSSSAFKSLSKMSDKVQKYFTKKGNSKSMAATSIVTSSLPHVKGPPDCKPIELRRLELKVRVVGLFSETTSVMEFLNPNSRDLEGHLEFPLPDNAVVSGYGLDVGGVMVEGVVVEKKEARRILEAEIRKGADPGLVEVVKGNVYRTRVYPILAGKSRTVSVTYSAPLAASGGSASLHLPLAHCSEVHSVTVSVHMCQTPVAPALSGGFAALKLVQSAENAFSCNGELTKGMRADDLVIALDNIPHAFASVERCDDALFFNAVCAKATHASPAAVWKPKALAVFWDASGSRKDVSKDVQLLRALLAAVCEATAVHVTAFRNTVAETASFECPAESEALFGFLGTLHYDGATNLAALDLSGDGVDALLLFSDGLHTVDGLDQCSAMPVINSGKRVFTVNSSADCDASVLQHISERTGAKSINLLRQSVEHSLAEIVACVCKEPVAVCVHYEDGSVVDAAAADCFVDDQGSHVLVCGRIPVARHCTRVVVCGVGAEAMELSVGSGHATVCDSRKASLLGKNWAALEAERLRVTGGNNASEGIVDLGRRFGVVTAGTSLLVLESLEQYLEYQIEPPASLKRMRTEYLARVRQVQRQRNDAVEANVARVTTLWKSRLQWYDTDFDSTIKAELKRLKMGGGQKSKKKKKMASLRSCQPMAEMNCEMSSAMAQSMDDCMDLDGDDEDKCDDEKSNSAASSAGTAASICVRKWEPAASYMVPIRAAESGAKYAAYMSQRAEYCNSPAFFLDCGDHFFGEGLQQLAVRILSNLSEVGLDSAQLKRMQAYRLLQAQELDLAVCILQAVHGERDDEPQSHRDLALALARRWEAGKLRSDAKKAVALFCNVITKQWGNFPEIEVIALVEMNRLLTLFTAHSGEWPHEFLDARFAAKWKLLVSRPLELDLRISMQWDTDLTDVDLHVYEPPPLGEHCNYSHNRTKIGGLVSRDFTQGYGPEEYILKKAQTGKYTIKAHYYSSRAQSVSGAVTVIVDVFTNYGRASEKRQALTLRLEKSGTEVLVGDVTID